MSLALAVSLSFSIHAIGALPPGRAPLPKEPVRAATAPRGPRLPVPPRSQRQKRRCGGALPFEWDGPAYIA